MRSEQASDLVGACQFIRDSLETKDTCEMADYVGRWKCQCGTEVWGILKHCPSCGSGTTGKYYLPDGEPPITADEVALKIAQSGPNWLCNFCSSDNWGFDEFCTQCGSSRHGTEKRKTKVYDGDNVPHSEDQVVSSNAAPYTSTYPERDAARTNAASSLSSPSLSYSLDNALTENTPSANPLINFGWLQYKKQFAAVIVAVMALAGGWYAFFDTYEVTAQVAEFEWNRTIHIQEYRTVREGDWSVPSGGRQISTEQRVHHHRQVFDHYETKTRRVVTGYENVACGSEMVDNGNGTFSSQTKYCSEAQYGEETYEVAVYRSEPVYQTWYTYDIDRWVESRNVPTSGERRNDPQPHWGEFSLNCNGVTEIGCERESSREEHYLVIFSWEDDEETKTHRAEVDRADWDAYQYDTEYTLELNHVGQLKNDPLHPESEE